MDKDNKENYMNDLLEMMRFIENAAYEEKLVAFIDIMGMSDKISSSKEPRDFLMYNTILYMIKRQGFERDLFQFFAFSDCMYIITDKENIQELLLALSLLSYYMLFDNSTKNYAGISNQYVGIEKVEDFYKVRGGVTFGKVLSVPQNNVVLGKGVIEAYALESKKAMYPRIIFDDKAMEIVKEKGLSDYMGKDNDETESFYYLDFIKFISCECGGIAHDLECIDRIIEYVEKEWEESTKLTEKEPEKSIKLEDKLEWYINYLKKHKKTGE